MSNNPRSLPISTRVNQRVIGALCAACAAGSDLSTDLRLRELKGTRPLSVVRSQEVNALRTWASSHPVPAS